MLLLDRLPDVIITACCLHNFELRFDQHGDDDWDVDMENGEEADGQAADDAVPMEPADFFYEDEDILRANLKREFIKDNLV